MVSHCQQAQYLHQFVHHLRSGRSHPPATRRYTSTPAQIRHYSCWPLLVPVMCHFLVMSPNRLNRNAETLMMNQDGCPSWTVWNPQRDWVVQPIILRWTTGWTPLFKRAHRRFGQMCIVLELFNARLILFMLTALGQLLAQITSMEVVMI